MPSRADLWDHASDVARRLHAFAAYRSSRARAQAALRRRAPGFSELQYRQSLDRALAMFKAAEVLVRRHEIAIAKRWPDYDVRPLVGELRRHHPGFARSTYEWVVDWVILYYVLM